MLDGQLDHFLDLLDLLVQASNHFIGGVWHLLHHHEGHQGIHLVGQDLVQSVAVIPQSHAAVRGHLRQKDVSILQAVFYNLFPVMLSFQF